MHSAAVLYHSSSEERDVLLPHPSRVVNNESVVFAGERWFALACAVPGRGTLDFGKINGVPYITGNLDDLRRPTWLHAAEADEFEKDPRICRMEAISRWAVIPVSVEYIPDVYAELLKLGISMTHVV